MKLVGRILTFLLLVVLIISILSAMLLSGTYVLGVVLGLETGTMMLDAFLCIMTAAMCYGSLWVGKH